MPTMPMLDVCELDNWQCAYEEASHNCLLVHFWSGYHFIAFLDEAWMVFSMRLVDNALLDEQLFCHTISCLKVAICKCQELDDKKIFVWWTTWIRHIRRCRCAFNTLLCSLWPKGGGLLPMQIVKNPKTFHVPIKLN
ncbi:hypothetical protein SEVIR_3G357301v4 [Setaria viridis]